mmetsp:Transcript_73089/g.138134  ORF Transcript_73089/g.138134 Transcript_73089/m.138134 type:complete len:91 (+) Transcript_73089:1-273(+)
MCLTAGTASLWPLLPVVAAQAFGNEQASSVFSWGSTANMFSALIGAPSAAALASRYGWPFTLKLFSLSSMACMLLMISLGRKRSSHRLRI